MMAIDAAGMVMGWRFFDHAAHFSGILFGIFWCHLGQTGSPPPLPPTLLSTIVETSICFSATLLADIFSPCATYLTLFFFFLPCFFISSHYSLYGCLRHRLLCSVDGKMFCYFVG
jgi:hypothetical protein